MPNSPVSYRSYTMYPVITLSVVLVVIVTARGIGSSATDIPIAFVVFLFVYAAGLIVYFTRYATTRCEVAGDELHCGAMFRTRVLDLHDVDRILIRRQLTNGRMGIIQLTDGSEIKVTPDLPSRFEAFAHEVQTEAPWIKLGP